MAHVHQEVQNALLACAQANEQALQRLFHLEAPRMMSLALHMVGQRAIAEDLITDTFVLIWKNADSYDPDRGDARAWVYSILRYRALGRLRQAGRPAGSQTGFASFPSVDSLNSAAPASHRPQFLKGLANLDDTARQAVFLAFFKGFDYPRIAQRLERSVSQARHMVTLALQALLDDAQTEAVADDADLVRLAEYTLGLLAPDEVKSVHAQLAHEDSAVLQALEWEDRFLALTDLLTIVHPSGQVYYRIQARLGHDAIPAPSALLRQPEQSPGFVSQPAPARATDPLSSGLPASTQPPSPQHEDALAQPDAPALSGRSQADGLLQQAGVESDDLSNLPQSPARGPAYPREPDVRVVRTGFGWKVATLVFALVAAAAWAMNAVRPPPEPPVTIVRVAPKMGAILQPPGSSSTPAWVVSMDHQQNLSFRPLVQTETPGNTVVMLWTQFSPTERPRLLATIDPNKPFGLAASQAGLIREGQILEMTQEPVQADAPAQPQGPVLYIGKIVSFGQSDAP